MKLPTLAITRRHVQVALGSIWLLDGVLQLQHQMFTSAFATQVIDPAIQGQPTWVGGPMRFFVHVFLTHPAICNSLIALAQLGIGVLILWKRSAKWGLLASVPWGLFVWAIGEGYGGMFNGQASLLMGAPGAAVLYVMLALAVLPTGKKTSKKRDTPQQAAASWLLIVWAALWFGGAVWQLTATGQDTASGMKSMILANAQSAPHWLASTDAHLVNTLNKTGAYKQPMITGQSMNMMQMAEMPTEKGTGDWLTPTLAILMLFTSMGVFVSGWVRKTALGFGIAIALLFWIVGQNLGSYYTGTATDPNSGPLIVLLAVTIWGCAGLDAELKKFYNGN
jgi:hypothetical protein